MTDMEMNYAGQIVEWTFLQEKKFDSHEGMVNSFWSDKLPNSDFSMQFDGDSQPMTDWDFNSEQPEINA